MKTKLLLLASLTCIAFTGCHESAVVYRRPYAPARTVVVENYDARPHPRGVWVNGHYEYRHHHRYWVPGHWVR